MGGFQIGRLGARRALIGLIAAIVLAGCDDPRARLVGHAETAALGGGRAAAAAGLEADFRAGRVTLDLALDHAFFTIEDGSADPAYVGAVLDCATRVEDAIPASPELSTLLLRRIGRLAFQGAEAAYLAGDVAGARSLVLAGPGRWQTESYWMRYPDHDALAAVLLAATGDRGEALRRLGSRPVLNPPADEAFALVRNIGP